MCDAQITLECLGNLMEPAFMGIILFLLPFSLFQYFQTKKKFFLYYGSYILCTVFSLFFIESFEIIALILNQIFSLSLPVKNPVSVKYEFLVIGMAALSYFLFINSILKLSERNPINKKSLRFLSRYILSLLLIILIATVFNCEGKNYLEWGFEASLLLLALYTIYFLTKVGDPLSPYIIAGTASLVFAVLINLINGISDYKFLEALSISHRAPIYIAVFIEVTIFTSILGFRIRLIEQEKAGMHQKLAKQELEKHRREIEDLSENQQMLEVALKPQGIDQGLLALEGMIREKKLDLAMDYLHYFSDFFHAVIKNLHTSISRFSSQESLVIIDQLDMLKNHVSLNHCEKVTLKNADGWEFVNVKDIAYIESDGAYTHVYLSNYSKRTEARLLKEWDKLLPQHIFCRIHDKYIINYNYLTGYRKKGETVVILRNEVELKVSRQRKKLFEFWIQKNTL